MGPELGCSCPPERDNQEGQQGRTRKGTGKAGEAQGCFHTSTALSSSVTTDPGAVTSTHSTHVPTQTLGVRGRGGFLHSCHPGCLGICTREPQGRMNWDLLAGADVVTWWVATS